MQPVTGIRLLGVRLGLAVLAFYWTLIFVGTHLPTLPNAAHELNDKVLHFTAFFGLATLLCYVTNSRNWRLRFSAIIVVCLLYAAMDEWSQSLVRGRQTDVYDLLADASGTVTAVALYLTGRSIWLRRYSVDGPAVPSADPPAV
ncbi:MAG: VanZ family protein [Planctomycetota bacterium]